MRSLISILCISLFMSCNTSTKKADINNVPPADEADAIKKAVDDAYRCISFKQGQQLNYDSIKSFFLPQAQLINFRDDTLEILSIDQFAGAFKAFIKSNDIRSFYEEEIKGNTDQFGRIAQRISTYETYINTMDSVAQRGVNSFQLVKTTQSWKVSSIIWDIESPKLKIPAYYLKVTDTGKNVK